MATLFVASGGSNTAPYDTWAKAATSLATALAAASSDGDIVVIQYNAVPSGDAELSADTTYTAVAAITLLSASNGGGSTYTPTDMGTANWIGNSSTNRSITWIGPNGKTFRRRGLTYRTSGSTSDNIGMHSTVAGGYASIDDGCYFWSGNSSSTTRINIGGGTAGRNSTTELRNPTFRFGNSSQALVIRNSATVKIVGGSIDAAGSTPTTFIDVSSSQCNCIDIEGLDATVLGSGQTVIGDAGTNSQPIVYLRQCKFAASVTILATQTQAQMLGIEVYALDCQIGSAQNFTAYYNTFGKVEPDTSIYYTGGAAGSVSWKITTTANATNATPFVTPWLTWHNTGTSSVTPRFEVLRDGSSTAYTDAELWAEFAARVTSSSVLPTLYRDRAASIPAAAAQANGAGLGSWTGESGTAWSGKIDAGSSLTPSAAGALRGRVAFAAANASVYVEPLIRVA